MAVKTNKINALLQEIGYKELNVVYNNKDIIINQDVYHYHEISDVLCIQEHYDSCNLNANPGINFFNDQAYHLEGDELDYLTALLNGNEEIKIELEAVYLLIRDIHYHEKRYLVGIFPNDDDELQACKLKGESCAKGIIGYCNELNQLTKESEADEKMEFENILESILNQSLKPKENQLPNIKNEITNNLVKAKMEIDLKAGMYFESINYQAGWYDIYVVAGAGEIEYQINDEVKKMFFNVDDKLSNSYRNLYLPINSSIALNTGIELKLVYLGTNPK